MRVLAAGLVLLAACSRAPDAPRSLLLVTVDTLRADALGSLGGARRLGLDELAAQGELFENAFTPRSMTFPALSSLFTGLSPIEHGALSNGDLLPRENTTLAETLERAGFFTAAFTTNKLLVPGSGLEQGFTSFESDFSRERDEKMAAAAARCLSEHAAKGERVFVWLHLVGPHLPYAPEPLDGIDFKALCCAQGYAGPADGSHEYANALHAAGVAPAPADLEHMRGLYAAEVARADHVLTRMFATLDLSDCLLVFAADHGEELGERRAYFGHSKSVTSAGLHVPLFLRHPGTIAPTRTREPFGLQELRTRILAQLGLGARADVPASLEVGLWRDRIFSARDARWRLVWNPENLEPLETPPGSYPVPQLALYDELADPRDEHDLAASHPDEVARLRAAIEHWRAQLHPWTGQQSAPDAARQRALHEMGYAGEGGKLQPR
ncbi:MAG: sulfatase-like hydrolase/transferase [Planctomycetes bacterium]|nr:sulfatase-like hydrolase/transferase [Planctomycetota bacterium]